MNIEQFREIAAPIIKAKYGEVSDDDLKMELMTAGVGYSALNAVVKGFAIEFDLMVDPKQVTNDINAMLEKYTDWEALSEGEYETLAELAGNISDAIDGSTPARVITLARAYCKNEQDLDLPKKPRTGFGGGARVGKIAQAVVDLFKVNPKPTKQEFYDAMVPVVGGDQQHANIIYYMGLHMAVCTAVVGGGDLEAISKELALQANPKPGEGVSAEPRGTKGAGDEADEADEADEDEEEEEVM